MKRIYSLLMAIALIAVMQVSYSKSDLQERVAQVFGKDIFISDLNPNDDQFKMLKRAYRNYSDEEVLEIARSQKLASLIWAPIMDEFAKIHDVEPTEEEIQSYAKFVNADPEFAKSVPKISDKDARKIYYSFVKDWKVSKALYEEYGGTVIFQQANPQEPVGAARKLLEIHEAKGNFKIYDEKLKRQFWEYYVTEPSFQIPQKDVDFSKPWWLQVTSPQPQIAPIRSEKEETPDSEAISSLSTISTSCEIFRAGQLPMTYPPNLKALSEAKDPYVDEETGNGKKNGYIFTYILIDANKYTCVATPEKPGVSGSKTYFMDESGVIRLNNSTGNPVE